MNEELKKFDIDINDIKESNNLIDNIHEAIHQMSLTTMKDRFEVILNNNLIEFKEKATNYRTIFGCKISYDNLPKDISFIVREDTEPSYDKLQSNWNNLREFINDWIKDLENQRESIEGTDLFENHTLVILDDIKTRMNELEGKR